MHARDVNTYRNVRIKYGVYALICRSRFGISGRSLFSGVNRGPANHRNTLLCTWFRLFIHCILVRKAPWLTQ
jgi:hypothetical protein